MAELATAVGGSVSLPPDLDTLAGRLRLVIDPELGVNIVHLGLVYGAEVVDSVAHVLMTTTPVCPIGPFLYEGGPTPFGGPIGAGFVDELFLTNAPQIAGRMPFMPRLALVDGLGYEPGATP